MREAILIVTLAAALGGCDSRPPAAAPRADAADNAAAAAVARDQTNAMVAATRQEVLEARVATLENQMDTLKAEVDTRADLGDALATPARPPVAPPASAAPRLPYEATGGPAN